MNCIIAWLLSAPTAAGRRLPRLALTDKTDNTSFARVHRSLLSVLSVGPAQSSCLKSSLAIKGVRFPKTPYRLRPFFVRNLEARSSSDCIRLMASVNNSIESRLGGKSSPSETSNRIRHARYVRVNEKASRSAFSRQSIARVAPCGLFSMSTSKQWKSFAARSALLGSSWRAGLNRSNQTASSRHHCQSSSS